MASTNFIILIVQVFLLVLINVAETQRTFMRTCECEYMIDGKCAYTILLPVGSDACPQQQAQDQLLTGAAGSITDLQGDIGEIRANLSHTATWLGEQSRLLTNLQSTLIALQQTNIHENNTSDTSTNQNTNTQLSAMVGNIQTQVESLESSIISQQNINNQMASRIEELTNTQHENAQSLSNIFTLVDAQQTTIRNLNNTLVELQGSSWVSVCNTRGLLVSGDVMSIPDSSISAQSEYDDHHVAVQSRIHVDVWPGAWCPAEPNDNEWLQFDFGETRVVFGVVTKGRADYSQWVTSYKFAYTTEEPSGGATWRLYTDVLGEEQIFTGNSDQNTAQMNTLWQPIRARAIRIYPQTAGNDSNQCMRADVIGCVD